MKLIFETGQNFSAFLAARLIFVTVLLGVAALFRQNAAGLTVLVALFLANTTLSLGCAEWHRRETFQSAARWTALTGAVVIDTLVLRTAGGGETEFAYLYFFSVGAAGLLMGIAGSLWTALLSSLAICWLISGEGDRFGPVEAVRMLGFTMALTVTALFASYVFARMMQRERSHRATVGELEQTRLDTQAILDSLGTGLIVLNRRADVMYSNPAARTILNLTEESSPQALLKNFLGHLREQEGIETLQMECERREIEVPTPTGSKPVGFTISQMRDRKSTPRGHIILFSDLTKAKDTERRERERERLAAIGLLSSDLAHEIRNPLASVRGCTEMISVAGPVTEEQQKYLSLALTESDRLNGLLANFLNFAQLRNPNKSHGDLFELIHRQIDKSPVKIEIVDRLRGEYETAFDEEQIALAVDLILITLSEWAEGASELRVESKSKGSNQVLFRLPEVIMPREKLSTVFRPFSGAQRAGHGLAMPTAMRILHAHEGQLRVDSQPELGTYFEMSL